MHCHYLMKICGKQEYPERLMLTYKQEEDTTPHEEDTDSPVEEPKPVPIEDFAASNDVPEPTQAPPPPTFNSKDPDDLLVFFSYFCLLITHCASCLQRKNLFLKS